MLAKRYDIPPSAARTLKPEKADTSSLMKPFSMEMAPDMRSFLFPAFFMSFQTLSRMVDSSRLLYYSPPFSFSRYLLFFPLTALNTMAS